jgi:hypothetical protein
MSNKTSGLGSVVKVADSGAVLRIISNDVSNYQFAVPRAVQDTTGVDKFASERLLLLADFSVTLNGIVNFADANMSHAVFSTISSTSVVRAVELDPCGTTSTFPKLPVNCVLTDYQWTRANSGELTWQVPGALADGTAPTWTTN